MARAGGSVGDEMISRAVGHIPEGGALVAVVGLGLIVDGLVAAGGKVVVVTGIHGDGEEKLFLVAHAFGALGFFLGGGQRGQEQAGEDRDDGDDDEEFDERERAPGGGHFFGVFVFHRCVTVAWLLKPSGSPRTVPQN